MNAERKQGNSSSLVQFLIGGVQKGGTTALHDMLSEHPEIFLPEIKELHYFDKLPNNFSSEDEYQHYHSHFTSSKAEQMCGETTPSYIFFPSVAAHVYRYNPNMKWIILLRNPALGTYSQWNMAKTRGIEPLSFADALAYEKDRSLDLPANKNRRYAYAKRSQYAEQIRNLLEYFPKEQCLFLKSESLKADSQNTLNAIVQFLGVSEFEFKHRNSHAGTYSHTAQTDKSTLNKLSYEFRDLIDETEKLTGLDLTDWRYDTTTQPEEP